MKIALVETITNKYLSSWSSSVFYSLIRHDLVKRGHVCDIIRIDWSSAGFFSEHVVKGYDLVGLICVSEWSLSIIEMIRKTSPHTLILVGGYNAIASLDVDYDYLIQGSGRIKFNQLIDCISTKDSILGISDLFYKKRGVIHHTGIFTETDIHKELDPFKPNYDFNSFGQIRKEDIDHATIVGNLGCPYSRPIGKNHHFRALRNKIQVRNISKNAKDAIRHYLKSSIEGCSFCSISMNGRYRSLDEAVELVKQFEYQVRTFSNMKMVDLVAEDPYRLLPDFFRQVRSLKNVTFFIGGRVDFFLANVDAVKKSLEILKGTGHKMLFYNLGFENFSQDELDLFNKGVSVDQNLKVIHQLKSLKKDYPANIDFKVKNIILFNPWTTLDNLKENVRVMEREPVISSFDKSKVNFGTMMIYPWTPLHFKALNDGLLCSDEHFKGVPIAWRFQNEDVGDICSRYFKMCSEMKLDSAGNKERQLDVLKRLIYKNISSNVLK